MESYGFYRQRLMRTTAELRNDLGIEQPEKKDSEYKEIVREKRVFAPLVVPNVILYKRKLIEIESESSF